MKLQERNKPRTVLGVDPGSLKCGYGVVALQGKETRHVASGTISPSSKKPLQERLKQIYDELIQIIRTYKPDDIVVEKIFFSKGTKAALSLGHARGIVLLAAAAENIQLHEFSALQVKKAVVGYGRAEKGQVASMVKVLLDVTGVLSTDSADALALALCYLNTLQFNERLKINEK
ncbi:MAG: crossover junction endodeoxyribonuclease RuvC [Nitrospiraceae bacterium]|nr:MAG: crossover junction endodeoxyribonuclease RuvC [Nitrospiraceae bacterium]